MLILVNHINEQIVLLLNFRLAFIYFKVGHFLRGLLLQPRLHLLDILRKEVQFLFVILDIDFIIGAVLALCVRILLGNQALIVIFINVLSATTLKFEKSFAWANILRLSRVWYQPAKRGQTCLPISENLLELMEIRIIYKKINFLTANTRQLTNLLNNRLLPSIFLYGALPRHWLLVFLFWHYYAN